METKKDNTQDHLNSEDQESRQKSSVTPIDTNEAIDDDHNHSDIQTQVSQQAENIGPGKNMPKEKGGPKGPEPTRYGDWEVDGRCSDF